MMRLLRFPGGQSESNLPIAHQSVDNVNHKPGVKGFTSSTRAKDVSLLKSFTHFFRFLFGPRKAGGVCPGVSSDPELPPPTMPSERRNLRSSKDSTSSTNGEKSRADSSKSSSKDKPVPGRTTSSKGKPTAQKRGSKDSHSDKPKVNGTASVDNTSNGADEVAMADDGPDDPRQHKDGEEEMTVVVPPPKGSKLSGDAEKDKEGDIKMADGEEASATEDTVEKIDPKEKTMAGKHRPASASEPVLMHIAEIKANFKLLDQAVAQFDARFSLRVLRSISSHRKHLTPDVLAEVITDSYTSSNEVALFLLNAIGRPDASFDKSTGASEMEIDGQTKDKSNSKSPISKEAIPEVDTYLSILVQVLLHDSREFSKGAKFSTALVGRLRTLNRRTIDALAAKVYFYYSLFYEQLSPLPPSPMSPVVGIRPNLLAALRTAVLRKDQDIQATVTTLLLRNYISTSHITQADLLISHSQFPPAASNNQIARYLYYLGRIRAIQLSYSEAHDHLVGAARKSPSSHSAGGFYQASTKLLVVVELLMGDIPDRSTFRQPGLERALQPYFELVQAVRVGDLDSFEKLVQIHNSTFRRDGTYTLIVRLRQNVIKTGIRMMSLSYARISLRDICIRLSLPGEETAEYIVAKAIRDGVIEATLDHEHGYMKSKDTGDVYATREPGEAFHDRIRACLDLHDESVKVLTNNYFALS